MDIHIRMLPICYILFFFMKHTTSLDTIVPGQSIPYNETLVSESRTFELGFFSTGTSNNIYVGIWYKDSPSTIVWVANRESPPLNNTSGVLQLNSQGVLVLLDATKRILWSANVSTNSKAENPIAQLLDTGNFVVRNGHGNGNLLWQSFGYPCDTLLPGMKLGWSLETGLDRFLSSWKSAYDPGKGENIVKLEIQGYPQAVQLKGNIIKARAGHWNGLTFTGYPAQKPNPIYKYEFLFNEKEVYYEYELLSRSVFSRYVISTSGVGQRFVWTSQTSSWEVISTAIADQCENYALCGTNSVCDVSSTPVCSCLKGFEPKHPKEWNMSYWSNNMHLEDSIGLQG